MRDHRHADGAGAGLRAPRPLGVVRRGLALLPLELRKRVRRALGLAVLLAVLEASAFGALFLLIRVITGGGPVPRVVRRLLFAPGESAAVARLGLLAVALLLLRSIGSLVFIRIQANVQASTDAALSERVFQSFLAAPYVQIVQQNTAEATTNISYRVPDVAAELCGRKHRHCRGCRGSNWRSPHAASRLAPASRWDHHILRGGSRGPAESPHAGRSAQRRGRERSGCCGPAGPAGGRQRHKGNPGERHDPILRRAVRQATRTTSGRSRTTGVLDSASQLLPRDIALLGAAGLAIAVFQADRDNLVSTFGILVAAALRTLPSVNRIIGGVTGVRASESSLQALETALEVAGPLGHERLNAAPRRVPLNKALELRSVSYTYPSSERHALEGINLSVTAGQAIGLVGSSGAGKTTLVDIVLGLLEPDEGELTVDGKALGRSDVAGWRRSIGYVPQEVYLLDGSFLENVLFGRNGIAMAAVEDAICVAQLEEFVKSLPKGLQSRVGERGGRLSGGQRQRIGIARALVGGPDLLILDEATSALDNKTESGMTAALAGLKGRTTSIVIAHRLSTVMSCDQIALLDDGRLISRGSFDQLRRESPAFAELVTLGQLAPVME